MPSATLRFFIIRSGKTELLTHESTSHLLLVVLLNEARANKKDEWRLLHFSATGRADCPNAVICSDSFTKGLYSRFSEAARIRGQVDRSPDRGVLRHVQN